MKFIALLIQIVILFVISLEVVYDFFYRRQVLRIEKRLRIATPAFVQRLLFINTLLSIISAIIIAVILLGLIFGNFR